MPAIFSGAYAPDSPIDSTSYQADPNTSSARSRICSPFAEDLLVESAANRGGPAGAMGGAAAAELRAADKEVGAWPATGAFATNCSWGSAW